MKKLALPLTLSILLLLIYEALKLFKPETVAMAGYQYLLAALLIGFSVFVVRAISFVLFDVVFQKRKGREAPALLRGLLAAVLYTAFFLIIYKAVLGEQLGGFEIVATSTVVCLVYAVLTRVLLKRTQGWRTPVA